VRQCESEGEGDGDGISIHTCMVLWRHVTHGGWQVLVWHMDMCGSEMHNSNTGHGDGSTMCVSVMSGDAVWITMERCVMDNTCSRAGGGTAV